MSDPSDTFNPTQALDAVHSTRADLASRLDEGSWRYDLIYSGLAGVIVGGQALPMGWNALASVVGAGALGLLARDWARRKGVWVCGVTPRRARWVSVGLGLAIGALCAAVFFMTYNGGSRWIALPAGLAAAVAALIGSRLWRQVYRRDLQDDFAAPRMSMGLLFLMGLAAMVGSGLSHLLNTEEMVTAWLLGVGIGMTGMAAFMMARRRFRQGFAR